jgi:hypothetical protein
VKILKRVLRTGGVKLRIGCHWFTTGLCERNKTWSSTKTEFHHQLMKNLQGRFSAMKSVHIRQVSKCDSLHEVLRHSFIRYTRPRKTTCQQVQWTHQVPQNKWILEISDWNPNSHPRHRTSFTFRLGTHSLCNCIYFFFFFFHEACTVKVNTWVGADKNLASYLPPGNFSLRYRIQCLSFEHTRFFEAIFSNQETNQILALWQR